MHVSYKKEANSFHACCDPHNRIAADSPFAQPGPILVQMLQYATPFSHQISCPVRHLSLHYQIMLVEELNLVLPQHILERIQLVVDQSWRELNWAKQN